MEEEADVIFDIFLRLSSYRREREYYVCNIKVRNVVLEDKGIGENEQSSDVGPASAYERGIAFATTM